MGLDEAMIVAGIGCRKGASPAAVLAAVEAALAEHRRERAEISGLATGTAKRDEAGIVIAASTLGVPLHYVGDEALAEVAPRLITFSDRSAEATGSPSLSEASALAAAGENGNLLGPRIVAGPVTCALAEMDQDFAQSVSTLSDENGRKADKRRREGSSSLTPTPNPSPQGGGELAGSSTEHRCSTALARMATKSPSSLWGGVRGGGDVTRDCAPEEDGSSPEQEARP